MTTAQGLERFSKKQLEWRSRKLSLEMHGIPKTEIKVLISRLIDVAKALNVTKLSTNYVTSLQRLPARSYQAHEIIAHFSREETRSQWLEYRLKLKSGQGNIDFQKKKITNQNRTHLWFARQCA